ncbi:hypothetical protein AB5I41_31710 [Sphingomonas sp. MMS24-JH45]
MTTPQAQEAAAIVAVEATGYLAGDEAREVTRAVLATTPQVDVERLREALEPYEHHHGPLPDFDSPVAGVFNAGVQYAVELLAKELGVKDWTPCDGTEEYDGDLGGTLMNIVREAMPLDQHGERMWPRDVCAALASIGVSEPISGEGERAAVVAYLRGLRSQLPPSSRGLCSLGRGG